MTSGARLLFLTALLAVAAPDDPHVASVATSFSGRDVLVSARLVPGLPADVTKRLESGLPTTVRWTIGLFVDRGLWPPGKKDERRYEVTAAYRPVSSDYTVETRLDGKLLETRVVPSPAEAVRSLSEVPKLPCFTMGGHVRGKRLFVRLRSSYGSGLSLGVVPTSVDTDWVRSEAFTWNSGDEGP